MTAPSQAAEVALMSVEIDDERIATILFDQPESKVNVIGVAFVEQFERIVEGLPRDLRGLILASGKEGWIAGADLNEILRAPSAGEIRELVRRLHRVLNRLAALPYPSVAAINGVALGGGLELALACDYRVVVESEASILGLPEVSLGLLPAGGGTQRLPRLIGLSRALGLILESRRFSPRRARRYGVVDDVVHPTVLVPAAGAWAARGKRSAHPRWTRLDRVAAKSALVRSVIYRRAAKQVHAKTLGHYPAPLRALDAVRAGQEQGFGAGSAAEAVAFGDLVTGEVACNLIGILLATESLKREQRRFAKSALPVGRVAVIGAGFMGAGIAQVAASAGYAVRLRDVAPEAVARGLKSARDVTLGAVRRGRFSRSEAQAIVSRISGATDSSGFTRVQLVIEAVFEEVSVKREVIAGLDEVVSSECVIASNTSSLPISSLAPASRHPERVLGMHFFSPVHKMPLLEVVRAEHTSAQAVATAVEVGRAMGKTVIVVADGPGFFTTRVLGFMVQEAGRLFAEGASVGDIDNAMTAFGFPVGPLALTDEVGVDVAAHISQVLRDAFPDRFEAATAINRMVDSGRLGRKSKSGFYDYSGRKKKPDPRVYELRQSAPRSFPTDLIQRRLVLALVNESARCLEESVIACPRDGDIGAVMGIGFPPYLGGPFRYADALGLDALIEQLRRLEQSFGPTFAPAGILYQMLDEGTRFYPEVDA